MERRRAQRPDVKLTVIITTDGLVEGGQLLGGQGLDSFVANIGDLRDCGACQSVEFKE